MRWYDTRWVPSNSLLTLSDKVEEFFDKARIGEARASEASVMAYTADRRSQTETILKSERFQALSLFSSIYGIGPTTARKLCSLGLRSLDDLEIYYGVERASQRPSLAQGGDIVEVEMQTRTQRHGHRSGENKHGRLGAWGGEKGESNEGLGDSWIRIALELREDFAIQYVLQIRITNFGQRAYLLRPQDTPRRGGGNESRGYGRARRVGARVCEHNRGRIQEGKVGEQRCRYCLHASRRRARQGPLQAFGEKTS